MGAQDASGAREPLIRLREPTQKNAVSKLTDSYDEDPRVVGYVATGFSGVLPTSLAGDQSEALCDSYKAEGLKGTCEESAQSQTIASGSVYGRVVREMMTHWANSTTKPIVYVARPLTPGSLAAELESDPVDRFTHIAVVNNGFRDCAGQKDLIPRWQRLQKAGHIVGWWSIAVHGFPVDGNGRMVPGGLASGIRCAVEALDVTKLWLALAPVTWTANDDAIQVAHDSLHSLSAPKSAELRPPTTP